ncbi:MAG: hypothetical protein MJ174_02540 [Treponema sp.]|nr:hypothetical protein [Treponema sp.]
MSFCPTRDIHSIYLDNEMPEIYKAEYENHLNSCEKCKKELEKLKKLHSIFSSDAADLKLDQTFMDQSFERLQMKMKYSKTIKASSKEKSFNWKQLVPSVAAAAAVCTAILLPVQLTGNKTSTSEEKTSTALVVPARSSSPVSLNTNRSRVVSGNIPETALSSNSDVYSFGRDINIQNISNEIPGRRSMGKFDVFRPKFEDTEKSIKITVPDMNDIPVEIKISFQDTANAGQ